MRGPSRTSWFSTAVVVVVMIHAATAAAADGGSRRAVRRAFAELTPAQVEAVAGGADPAAIVLADGSSLADRLAGAAADADEQLVYTPVDPCVALRTAGIAAGALRAGEARVFRARGDLGAQGGAAGGCGIPEKARALAGVFRVTPGQGKGKGSLHAWPTGDPEPAVAVVEYGAGSGASSPAVVELCGGAACAGDFAVRALGVGAHVRFDVVGYFSPISGAVGPKGDPGPPGPAGPSGPSGPPGAPGASCSVSNAAGTATLTCPDGSTVSWPVGTQGPVRNFKIETPSIPVQAGQEIAYCLFFRTPNTETVGIRRWSSATFGSSPAVMHDLRLYLTRDASGQPVDLKPPGTLVACNQVNAPATTPQWIYNADDPTASLVLPADDGAGKPLATEVPAGSAGYVRIHFVNTNAFAVDAQVTVDAEALAPGVAYTRTATYVAFNGQISIPSGAQNYQELATCPVPAGLKFWRLSTHTHKQGVHAEVRDGTDLLVSGDDWQHPNVSTFAAPGFRTFATGHLTYSCIYSNFTALTLHAGDNDATDEQCVAIGYIFPASSEVFCFSNILVP